MKQKQKQKQKTKTKPKQKKKKRTNKQTKTKKMHLFSHSYLEFCYLCISSASFICQKYYKIIYRRHLNNYNLD